MPVVVWRVLRRGQTGLGDSRAWYGYFCMVAGVACVPVDLVIEVVGGLGFLVWLGVGAATGHGP